MGETVHSDFQINLLLELQRNGKFCDLFLVPEISNADNQSERVPCHKVIVVSVSPFLKEALLEGGKDDESSPQTLSIPDVNYRTLVLIVEYMYSGRIDFTLKNVFGIYEAARFLQLSGLRNLCQEFIDKKITPSNIIGRLNAAGNRNRPKLYAYCRQIFLQNYQELQGIGDLEFKTLRDILSREETVAVLSAEDRLSLVIRWLMENDNAEFRAKPYAFLLIKKIPLEEIPLKVLRDSFQHEFLKPKKIQELYISFVEEFALSQQKLNTGSSPVSIGFEIEQENSNPEGNEEKEREGPESEGQPKLDFQPIQQQLIDPESNSEHGAVGFDQSNKKRIDRRKIFVRNIPPEMNESIFKGFFSTCGKIDSVRIIRSTPWYQGYGFINFRYLYSAKMALKTDWPKFKGQLLFVHPGYMCNNDIRAGEFRVGKYIPL